MTVETLKDTFEPAAMIAAAAQYAVAANKSGVKAIVAAAVTLKASGDTKSTSTLLRAEMVRGGLSDGSAANYISKASAVASHWPDGLMPATAETFAEYVERAVIEVNDKWHNCGVNGFTKSGPKDPAAAKEPATQSEGSKAEGGETGEVSDKSPEDGTTTRPVTSADMLDMFETLAATFSDAELDELSGMIVAERDRRAEAAAATGTDG